ncbi:MAG: hypothetical protein AAF481_06305 [Acidobacteriota bacterium]
MTRRITALLSLLALLAVPMVAAESDAVVGVDGEVYVARLGSGASLFPGLAGTADGEARALALDITQPDGSSWRLRVPGTIGADLEHQPQLFVEDTSGGLFLIWESWKNYIHPSLKLVALTEGEWSPVLTLEGNRYALKGAPRMVITRDEYLAPEGDSAALQHRTILHLTWWEESAEGDKVLYAPVTLIDGEFPLDSPPTFELSALDLADPVGDPRASTSALARSPNLQRGRDENSVMAVIANPRTDRILTIELDVVPGEVVAIGDSARSNIIEIGIAGGGGPGGAPSLESLAEGARSNIIEIGARLEVEVGITRFLADQVREQILASGGGEIHSIADTARSNIIEIGARLARPGLDRSVRPGAAPVSFLEILTVADSDDDAHLVRMHPAGEWLAPQIEAGTEISLYTSMDGDELLIASDEQDSVRYIESRPEGWSSARDLLLDDTIDRSRAHEILVQRARHR